MKKVIMTLIATLAMTSMFAQAEDVAAQDNAMEAAQTVTDGATQAAQTATDDATSSATDEDKNKTTEEATEAPEAK